MFENCGSCFAAEQFVDIKLGTKCLLTLTSYMSYYTLYKERRQGKFLTITTRNARKNGVFAFRIKTIQDKNSIYPIFTTIYIFINYPKNLSFPQADKIFYQCFFSLISTFFYKLFCIGQHINCMIFTKFCV